MRCANCGSRILLQRMPDNAASEMETGSRDLNRHVAMWMVMLHGLVLGAAAFAVAEVSLPRPLDPTNHDVMLAQRLAFIFTPAVGAWLGWLQRSRNRILAGAVVGLGIAAAYYVLSMTKDFFAIMVGFPALLGAVLAGAIGSNRSHGFIAFLGRLGKGLIAGLVLGFAYMFLLNVILASVVPQRRLFEAYADEMWKGGLPAMAIASALFLVLIRWAVGLVRVHLQEL
jgi:hypothetical protein